MGEYFFDDDITLIKNERSLLANLGKDNFLDSTSYDKSFNGRYKQFMNRDGGSGKLGDEIYRGNSSWEISAKM